MKDVDSPGLVHCG